MSCMTSAAVMSCMTSAAVMSCMTSAAVTSVLPSAATLQMLPLAAVLDEVPQLHDGLQCLCCCLEWTEDVLSAKRCTEQQSGPAAVIHMNNEAQHSQQVRPRGAAVLALGQKALSRTGCALQAGLQLSWHESPQGLHG